MKEVQRNLNAIVSNLVIAGAYECREAAQRSIKLQHILQTIESYLCKLPYMMNALKCRTLASFCSNSKALEQLSNLLHSQEHTIRINTKKSVVLMNIQIMGIAWPSDLLRTSEFLDETSQIAV